MIPSNRPAVPDAAKHAGGVAGVLEHRPGVGDPAPPPLPLRSEEEVVASWRGTEPVVSCICNSYNHLSFIGDAVRGMLGQVTDFPFEIIVHDDASTDGTADVVRDFAARYPRIVRPILQTVNQYAARKPMTFTLPVARGEFIAFCEGDDYWLDPHKLERQVARLRADAGAVLSHHDALVICDGTVIKARGVPLRNRTDLTPAEIQRARWMPPATWLFRRAALRTDFLPYSRTVSGDKLLLSVLGLRGGAAFVADVVPSVYRRHAGGVWTSLSRSERRIVMVQTSYWLHHYHRERSGRADLADHFLTLSVRALAGRRRNVLRIAGRLVRGYLRSRLRPRAR